MPVKLCLLLTLATLALAAPVAPKFPEKYQMKADMNYFDFNLAVPMKVDFDAGRNLFSYSFYNGRDHQIYRLGDMTKYSIFPKKDHLECINELGLGAPSYLPNVDWKYVEDVEFRNIQCHKYAYEKDTESKFSVIELYTKQYTQEPVAVSLGKMVVHIYEFIPNRVNDTAFAVPSMCEGNKASKDDLPMHMHQTVDEILADNEAFAQKVNSRSDHPDAMRLGMNAFSHMSWEEFAQEMLHDEPEANLAAPLVHRTPSAAEVDSLPTEVDWTRKGMVTPVKNQAGCGSCWSFAVAATLETQYAIKHSGKQVRISQQNLMDCAWGNYSCAGCRGGVRQNGFQFLIDNQGGHAVHEYAYPYEMKNGYCHYRPQYNIPDFRVRSWVQVPMNDPEALQEAVARHGAIAVGICATRAFQLYTGGLFDDPQCDAGHRNHAVTIVGYGVTASGNKYWKVKNSWGDSWGVNGYFYIPRGVGKCKIEEDPCYPITE